MAVDQIDRIDAIGIDRSSGNVVLTISDHLPWDDAVHEHIEILRDKINAYLAFIESGELIQTYPDAAGRKVSINVIGKYDPCLHGTEFFENASRAISNAGFALHFEKFRDSH